MTPRASTRVWIQNVPVCTFKTSPCVPAPRAHVETHVRVVAANTRTFGMDTRRRVGIHIRFFLVFSACRNTNAQTKHTPRPQRNTPHNTTTRNNTRRQRQRETETERGRDRQKHRETETEKEKQRRRDKTRQEKRKRNKKREDETRKEKKREDERGEKRHVKMKEERRDM